MHPWRGDLKSKFTESKSPNTQISHPFPSFSPFLSSFEHFFEHRENESDPIVHFALEIYYFEASNLAKRFKKKKKIFLFSGFTDGMEESLLFTTIFCTKKRGLDNTPDTNIISIKKNNNNNTEKTIIRFYDRANNKTNKERGP